MTEPVPAQGLKTYTGVDKPLLKALLPALPRLAVSWRALGLKLGAKDYTLDLIQQSHKGDPEKCCSEMLLNWLLGKQDCGDCPRTWDDLLKVIESEMGSEACAFIKKEILNWAEVQVERRPVEATHVQVIQENSERFLQDMNARVVAAKLRNLNLIPESVEYDIDHSKSRENANGHLLTFLKQNATEEQALQAFVVASEERGYARMEEFAASILSKLQQVMPPISLQMEGGPSPRDSTRPHGGMSVEQVLDMFWQRFIADVDANAIVYDLEDQDIISDRDLKEVTRTPSGVVQNQFLHHRLKRKATKDTLVQVCDIMIGCRGNSRMNQVGKEMKSALETGGEHTEDDKETEADMKNVADFKESLKAALAKGFVEVEIVKCVTLGPTEAGKTQLKLGLMHRFEDSDESTAMSTGAEVVMERYISGKASWMPLTQEKLLNVLHTTVKRKEFDESKSSTSLPTAENVQSTSSPGVDQMAQPLPKGQQMVHSTTSATASGDEAKGIKELLKQFSEIRLSVEQGLQTTDSAEKEGLQRIRMVHFIDSGGQPSFFDIHPVIATSRAVYLLVYNMEEEGLEAKPKITYRKRNFPTKELPNKKHSNLDMIKDSLLVLHNCKQKFTKMENELQHWFEESIRQSKDALPVLVVGTRKKVGSMSSESGKLSAECSHLPTWNEVLACTDTGTKLFAVDSKEQGCKGLQSVRDAINKAECVYRLKLPLSWVLCQLIFWSAENEDLHVLTYADLQDLCLHEKLVANDAEFLAMIRTFHLLGICVFPYFDQEQLLGKQWKTAAGLYPIFTKPDVLYRQVTQILEVAFRDLDRTDMALEAKRSLNELQNRGLLKVDTLGHLGIKDKLGSYIGFQAYLLDLLVDWGLAAKLASKDTACSADSETKLQYFIPSVLPAWEAPLSSSLTEGPSCAPDLAFTFLIPQDDETKFYYMPRGIFTHMVTNTLATDKGYHLPYNKETYKCRYRDSVTFQIIRCPRMLHSYNVTLTDSTNHISILIQPSNATKMSDCDCHRIIQDFKSAIEDAYKAVYHESASVTHACPCPCGQTNKKHLAAILPHHRMPNQYIQECLSTEKHHWDQDCPVNIANIMKATDELLVSGQKRPPTSGETPPKKRQGTQATAEPLVSGQKRPPTCGETPPKKKEDTQDITTALNHQLDARWREFGAFLHVQPDLLDVISRHHHDVSDRMSELCTKWLRLDDGTGDFPRTWQTVVTAVQNLEYRQLAEQLANEYGEGHIEQSIKQDDARTKSATGGAMAPASNPLHSPSPAQTAVPPPPPPGGFAAACPLLTTVRQTSRSVVITHPAAATVDSPRHPELGMEPVLIKSPNEVLLKQLCYLATGIQHLHVGPGGGTFTLGRGDATLKVPPGALKMETTVHFAIILHGPFVISAGYKPGSVVVYINMDGATLVKPVCLHLSHWCSRKKEGDNTLKFIRASHMPDSRNEYLFKELEEGDFTTHSNEGVLTIPEPQCLYCVEMKEEEVARYNALSFRKEESSFTHFFRIQLMRDSKEWNKTVEGALQNIGWSLCSSGVATFTFAAEESDEKKVTACPVDAKGPGWICIIDGHQLVSEDLFSKLKHKSKNAFDGEVGSGRFPPYIHYKLLYNLPEESRKQPSLMKVDLKGTNENVKLSFHIQEEAAGGQRQPVEWSADMEACSTLTTKNENLSCYGK